MLIPLFVLIIVIVAVGAFFIRAYNQIVLTRNNVDKSFSNIDVILKQRADEIPNLVETVKATALYENNVLTQLVKLRYQYSQTENINEKIKIAGELDGNLKSLLISIENYPEIKATQSFLQLQKRLTELENMIADRREYFNESVNLYNTGIQVFPDVIFAKMMNYKKMQMLNFAEKEKQLKPVQL
ncbi:LemA family protein [Chryseobacterium turcicum]|uniref:LemA family protein n=1 Tax=Chryseobacterium turcicum TaxID=2898076 RepID=A0A9Q3YUM4_9FLAO|nr:LemA family protein [Chryseobacterium turcicum]MCD1116099.1 LemA family protein [Chryseobacterium turcicum]